MEAGGKTHLVQWTWGGRVWAHVPLKLFPVEFARRREAAAGPVAARIS